MPGQPVRRAVVEKLATLAESLDVDLPPTADERATTYLLAYTANGGRLSTLAHSLGCSRWLLSLWVNGDDERKANYARARTLSADALVDEGGDLLDAATRDTIAVANARAGWRKWLAGKYDPETWGEKPAGPVVYGDLHLHALQRPQGQAPSSALVLPSPRPFPEAPPALGPEAMGGGEVPISAPEDLLGKTGIEVPPISRGTPPSTSLRHEGSPSKNYTASGD